MVEADYLGQAPLRAVLIKRGRRPCDIDYARFMHVVSVFAPRNSNLN